MNEGRIAQARERRPGLDEGDARVGEFVTGGRAGRLHRRVDPEEATGSALVEHDLVGVVELDEEPAARPRSGRHEGGDQERRGARRSRSPSRAVASSSVPACRRNRPYRCRSSSSASSAGSSGVLGRGVTTVVVATAAGACGPLLRRSPIAPPLPPPGRDGDLLGRVRARPVEVPGLDPFDVIEGHGGIVGPDGGEVESPVSGPADRLRREHRATMTVTLSRPPASFACAIE